MKILMIGHGMVGHKFIESVLEQAGDDIELTIPNISAASRSRI